MQHRLAAMPGNKTSSRRPVSGTIVAKRLVDRYDTRVRWLKIKNPDYSQKEGREDLFSSSLQRTAHPAGWR
jgi:hypothetical protein